MDIETNPLAFNYSYTESENDNEYHTVSSVDFLQRFYFNVIEYFKEVRIVQQQICYISNVTRFFGHRYYQSHLRVLSGNVVLYCIQHNLMNLGSLNEKYTYHVKRLKQGDFVRLDGYCHYYLLPLDFTIYTCCTVDPREEWESYDDDPELYHGEVAYFH